jgi:hypothetical protein
MVQSIDFPFNYGFTSPPIPCCLHPTEFHRPRAIIRALCTGSAENKRPFISIPVSFAILAIAIVATSASTTMAEEK